MRRRHFYATKGFQLLTPLFVMFDNLDVFLRYLLPTTSAIIPHHGAGT
uniref:G-protein coupled receptors family 1 profile domain-containing protein n=1 Tax=Parascaris univalens TaxID=6257 RepID=A0A915C0Y6_PARUN